MDRELAVATPPHTCTAYNSTDADAVAGPRNGRYSAAWCVRPIRAEPERDRWSPPFGYPHSDARSRWPSPIV